MSIYTLRLNQYHYREYAGRNAKYRVQLGIRVPRRLRALAKVLQPAPRVAQGGFLLVRVVFAEAQAKLV
jgi:hypothetical protein